MNYYVAMMMFWTCWWMEEPGTADELPPDLNRSAEPAVEADGRPLRLC